MTDACHLTTPLTQALAQQQQRAYLNNSPAAGQQQRQQQQQGLASGALGYTSCGVITV